MQAPSGQARPANLQKTQHKVFVQVARPGVPPISNGLGGSWRIMSSSAWVSSRSPRGLGWRLGFSLSASSHLMPSYCETFRRLFRIPRLQLSCLGDAGAASDSLVVHHRVLQVLDPGLSITSSHFSEVLPTCKSRRTEAWFTREKAAQGTKREKQKKLCEVLDKSLDEPYGVHYAGATIDISCSFRGHRHGSCCKMVQRPKPRVFIVSLVDSDLTSCPAWSECRTQSRSKGDNPSC